MRLRRLLVISLVSLLATLGLTMPASASAATPLCTDISFEGPSGRINIRTSPSRFVAWNIRMYPPELNDGPWRVDVHAGSRRVDSKTQN